MISVRAEIEAENDKRFDAGRIVCRADERDQIEMGSRRGPPLQTGADQEFGRRFAVDIRAGGAFEIYFDAGAKFFVYQRVTDGLAETHFTLASTADFLLIEDIETPLPTRAEIFAEQQLHSE